MMVEITFVSSTDQDLLQMVDLLDQELLERYPAEEIHGLDFSDPLIDQIFFAVAYDKDGPIGCGAIRPLDEESVELKRFFVKREYRGTGVSAQLLQTLEAKALEHAYRIVRLETGAEQPDAIRFYEKHGYYWIENFGEYIQYDHSICYEKKLHGIDM